MRSGRRLTWLIFALCVLLVVDGLGWVSWRMVGLERRASAARAEADRQELVRLALWRMESLLNPVIAQEAARPYFQYRAFYPADRAYTRMWDELLPGEVLVPSPLLAGPGEFVRLHFESTPEGWLTSPQAPSGEVRALAEQHGSSPERLLEAERRLTRLNALVRGRALDDRTATHKSDALGEAPAPVQLELQAWANLAQDQASENPEELRFRESSPTEGGWAESSQALSQNEFQKREESAQRARSYADSAQRADDPGVAGVEAGAPINLGAPAGALDGSSEVVTGPMTPVWLVGESGGEPELVLVRTVRTHGRESFQGVWLDWPALREHLVASVRDLLPEAGLSPDLRTAAGGSLVRPVADVTIPTPGGGEMLAGVPALLRSGGVAMATGAMPSATLVVLLVAWGAVLAAVVAIGLVLRASIQLSERRGRFVSAVTHELRTPLTTFCMYSQMLADGMVRDEARRGEYLTVLKGEAQRLAGIVENVLSYARLGRGARTREDAAVSTREILEGLGRSLRERCVLAGMALEIEDQAGEASVVGERDAVERVLANLVENACKYASGAADRRVTLRASIVGRRVEFRVCDRGPGVPASERRRVFSPFVRARRDALSATPGLGLGLALGRGVARQLGGDLRLARGTGPGAEFVLTLPLASARGG